jgi:histidyl-tRNA synthetase
MDFLGEASLKHLDAVRAVLDAVGQPYRINPRLVRGMDYYNLTVFEWVTDRLGAQGTVCGGGRYDGLIELIGGKPAPAVGWGWASSACSTCSSSRALCRPPRARRLRGGARRRGAAAGHRLCRGAARRRVSVLLHAAGKDGLGSMKSQFKKADASGARHALIFGADELARGEVSIKPLRDAAAPQRTRALADVAGWAHELRTA